MIQHHQQQQQQQQQVFHQYSFFCSCLSSPSSSASSHTSSNTQPPQHRPVKRIAIIGSGISGLAVTHALINNVQHPQLQANNIFDTIDIFDARTSFDHTAGAGIQLNGGLNILGKINPTLQNAVYNTGLQQTQIQSRTNPWFTSTQRNNSNNQQQQPPLYNILLQLDLKQTVQAAGGMIADALLLPTTKDDNNDNDSNVNKSPNNKKLLWISIMRGALQQALYESLPQHADTTNETINNPLWRLQFQKKLIHIRSVEVSSSSSTNDGSSNTEVYCQFDDGTESGPYDIIIGCEGINSKVKQYIESSPIERRNSHSTTTTSNNNNNNSDKDLKVRSAIYSGLRIRYAVADGNTTTSNTATTTSSSLSANITKTTTAQLTQFFGDGAYALHGIYGTGINQPPTQCAFIVYLDENYIGPFRRRSNPKELSSSNNDKTTPTTIIGENADWTQDQRRTVEVARVNMLQQLNDCHIPGSNDDILRHTIRNANRFFELGSYYHNPFGSWSCTVTSSSSSSSSNNNNYNHNPAHVVLCGDAAHALPPFLGQGSNQAIQDAYCLAERIFEYNKRIANGDTDVTLQSLLNEYQQRRWQPCFEIFWKAAFLGYLETGGTNGLYSKFRDVFFQSMGIIGVASKVLLNAATPKV